MLEVLALVLSGGSVIAILALAGRIRALEQRQREFETPPQVSLPEPVQEKPLAGKTCLLNIDQDHPTAPFAAMLKDLLSKEDVAVVHSAADLEVRGSITCNGYGDIYFAADLTCFEGQNPICTVLERPPHGDRPLNLGTELIARLKREIKQTQEHSERHQALKELKSI